MRFPRPFTSTPRPPASTETGVIHVQEVSVDYGGAPVLNGFSLLVRAGEFVSVLGRSGVGKTTALRVIAGFEHVNAGYVRLGGLLVGSSFIHVPPDRRRVGIVFQDYALFPHLTVAENVAFGLQGIDRREREARVRPVIDMTGLTGLERRYPHEMSGGQQQRVALARALAPRPVALLLDEPFSNLDRNLRSTLRREVRDIVKRAGATTVLVTHDREEALALADRVAVMGNGRVEQFGTPEDVYERPVSPEVARMTGPCEVIPGTMRGSVVITEAGEFPVVQGQLAVSESSVQVLMRAADLELGLADPETAEAGAFVVYREFRGEFTQYGVRLPSGMTLRVQGRSVARLPDGARVTVRTRPGAKVLVFPKTAGTG
ncbi:MAG: ABC transporter ATP-binding protein [Dehalococcoidia bacterium]|nr:ABC transporter ATP-binding protein [Dehalococcoidia bacterium]MSQ35220.1 ABC transporter ATP-binding protein [Dehalococcoidia bacterium]